MALQAKLGRFWIVFVLTFASAVANAGASLLSACLPLIKAEFGYSDTQLGLLTGYASALTFAVMTLPISSAALRWGNARVFGACLLVYSAANAATAACTNFVSLVAARFGSGLGPASEFPLGQALVSDQFPPEQRSGALATYSLGYFAGVTGGLTIGGYVAASLGWRWAFLLLGLVGAVAAVAQVLATSGAKRGHAQSSPSDKQTSSWTALRELARNRLYLNITLGYGWSSFATFGLVQWMPSYYNRQFGLPPEQAAALFGGVYFAGALCGLLSGGWLGNRLGASKTPKLLVFCIASYSLTFPLIAIVLFSPYLYLALAANVLATFLGSAPNGPVLAMIQNELPKERRVLGASMFLLTLTLLGAGGGPLIIGLLSDFLGQSMRDASLRWSMFAVKLLGLFLFFHLIYAYFISRRQQTGSLQLDY